MSISALTASRNAKFRPAEILIPLGGFHEKEALYARVSPEDAAKCLLLSWRADRRKHTTYAKANIYAIQSNGKRKRTTVLLHRYVANPPEGFETHHRDRDGLNCTRENLENVPHSINSHERDAYGTSGFIGVCKCRKKWRAAISIIRPGTKTRSRHIGVYETAIEAAHAYDNEARRLYGPFARVNFPFD